MTIEEVKKELKEYSENIKYIIEKQEDLEELEAILEKTTPNLSLAKTSNTSINKDKFSDAIYRMDKLKKEKYIELEKLLLKKFIIDDKIDKLKYPERDVLFMRYSRRKKWTYIADKIDCSVDNIYKIHGKGLINYSKI